MLQGVFVLIALLTQQIAKSKILRRQTRVQQVFYKQKNTMKKCFALLKRAIAFI